MFTLPSARRYLLPAAILFIFLVFLRLLSETGILQSSQQVVLQAALQAYLSNGARVTVLNATTHPHLFTAERFADNSFSEVTCATYPSWQTR